MTGGRRSKVHVLKYSPVGHADDEDVVELVDAVNLGEELVHHGVVDAGAARHGAPRLADGVDLVEYNDVQPRVGAHPLLLLLGLGEEPTDVGLRLAYVPWE